MGTTVEKLTVEKAGRGRYRHWSDEFRARIVSGSLRAGLTVDEVTDHRDGLKPSHLSSWRTMARQGKLVLPAPEDGGSH